MFLGPLEILQCVGVTNELGLPLSLSAMYLIFHVLILNKYHFDGSPLILWDLIDFYQDLKNLRMSQLITIFIGRLGG